MPSLYHVTVEDPCRPITQRADTLRSYLSNFYRAMHYRFRV